MPGRRFRPFSIGSPVLGAEKDTLSPRGRDRAAGRVAADEGLDRDQPDPMVLGAPGNGSPASRPPGMASAGDIDRPRLRPPPPGAAQDREAVVLVAVVRAGPGGPTAGADPHHVGLPVVGVVGGVSE